MSDLKAHLSRHRHIPVITKEVTSKLVSDGIGDTYRSWNAKEPVLISAQTGSGKNYFVENVLIPYVRQNKKRLLLVSNRVAVSLQQKRRIAKLVGCESILRQYTSEGLRVKTDFGCVYICTYQNLERILYNKVLCGQLSECDYVVFDEVHYFMSDAVFNGKTGQLLWQIPQIFSNSIRVYLSATPDEVLPHITEAEYHARHQWEEEKMILVNGRFDFQTELYRVTLTLYQFGRDYRYLNCRYFTESSEIIDKIQSSSAAEKWLVFVSSRSDGQSLAEALGHDAVFLDANSRNIKALAPIWETLVDENKFDCRVLVCTSVLDNGVNIVDDAVKHIVTFTYDKTELLQMIGRKRVSKGEKVFLYLREPNTALLHNHHRSNCRLLAASTCLGDNYPQFLEEYSITADKEVMQMTYQAVPGKHSINPLAYAKLAAAVQTQERWTELLSQKGKGCIIKEMLPWLGKEYHRSCWLNYDSRKENKQKCLEFLQDNVDKSMDEENFHEFAASLQQQLVDTFGPSKSDRHDRPCLGFRAMNNRLAVNKMGYQINFSDGKYYLHTI